MRGFTHLMIMTAMKRFVKGKGQNSFGLSMGTFEIIVMSEMLKGNSSAILFYN